MNNKLAYLAIATAFAISLGLVVNSSLEFDFALQTQDFSPRVTVNRNGKVLAAGTGVINVTTNVHSCWTILRQEDNASWSGQCTTNFSHPFEPGTYTIIIDPPQSDYIFPPAISGNAWQTITASGNTISWAITWTPKTPTPTPAPAPSPSPSPAPSPTPPAPPSCTSALASTATTTQSSGTFTVYAYGVVNATGVLFPTWADTGGQDDIVWYEGVNQGLGTWKADTQLLSHPGYGSVNVHVYLQPGNVLCGTANFTKNAPAPVAPPAPTSGTLSFNSVEAGTNNPIYACIRVYNRAAATSDIYNGCSGYNWSSSVPVGEYGLEVSHPGISSEYEYPPSFDRAGFRTVSGADAQTWTISWTKKAITAIIIADTNLPAGSTGQAFSADIGISGVGVGFSTHIINGILPPGLQVTPGSNLQTVRINGTPTTVGTYPFTLKVSYQGQESSKVFSITISRSVTSLAVYSLEEDTLAGLPVIACFRVFNRSTNINVFNSCSSNLLDQRVDPGTYGLEVSPDASGKYLYPPSFDVAGDRTLVAGESKSWAMVWKKKPTAPPAQGLSIVTNILAQAAVGQFYQADFTASGGESSQYSWQLVGGLPPGIAFGTGSQQFSSGIGGTPTVAGTYSFSIRVTSASEMAVKQFTLTITQTEIPKATIGWLDSIENGKIHGWAYDQNHPEKSIDVHVYFDGRPGSVSEFIVGKTDVLRDDVNSHLKITGAHGFNITIPDKLKDGKNHTVFAYGIDLDDATGSSNSELLGVPKVFNLSPQALQNENEEQRLTNPTGLPQPIGNFTRGVGSGKTVNIYPVDTSFSPRGGGSNVYHEQLFPHADYDYDPAIISEDGQIKFWWCGYEQGQGGGDSIFYRSYNNSANQWSPTVHVLGPTAGAWDSFYVCNPSVIKGQFNANGQVFSYAMYYTATDQGGIGTGSSIGVAFSNDGITWTKYAANPVIKSNTYPTTTYGAGNPEAFLVSGKVVIAYNDTTLSLQTVRTSSDGINFSSPVAVSVAGINSGLGGVSGFAADAANGKVYGAWTHPVNVANGRAESGFSLYRMDAQSFVSGSGTWEYVDAIDARNTGKTANFSPGFIRDNTGSISSFLPGLSVYFSFGDSALPYSWDLARAVFDIQPDTRPTVTPTINRTPLITVDGVTRDGFLSGWAYDPNDTSAQIAIHVYFNGFAGSSSVFSNAITDVLRGDVNQYFSISGSHGFRIPILAALRNGLTHRAYVYAIDFNNPNQNTLFATPVTFRLGAATRARIISFSDGMLVRDSETIYFIEQNLKRPFVSLGVFEGLGYKLDNVVEGDTSTLGLGSPIASSNIRHPRGSVVNHNGTIYFMGADLRYPFSTRQIFQAWGHTDSMVVVANQFDLQVALGPPLGMPDNSTSKSRNVTNNLKPEGYLDGLVLASDAQTIGISGWAYDPDNESAPIEVHLYADYPAGRAGSQFLGSVTANLARSDVNQSAGIAGDHGFLFPMTSIPDLLNDGTDHLIYAYGIDPDDASGASNAILGSSPGLRIKLLREPRNFDTVMEEVKNSIDNLPLALEKAINAGLKVVKTGNKLPVTAAIYHPDVPGALLGIITMEADIKGPANLKNSMAVCSMGSLPIKLFSDKLIALAKKDNQIILNTSGLDVASANKLRTALDAAIYEINGLSNRVKSTTSLPRFQLVTSGKPTMSVSVGVFDYKEDFFGALMIASQFKNNFENYGNIDVNPISISRSLSDLTKIFQHEILHLMGFADSFDRTSITFGAFPEGGEFADIDDRIVEALDYMYGTDSWEFKEDECVEATDDEERIGGRLGSVSRLPRAAETRTPLHNFSSIPCYWNPEFRTCTLIGRK